MLSLSTALATFKMRSRGNAGLAILGVLVDDGALECNGWHQPDVVLGVLK